MVIKREKVYFQEGEKQGDNWGSERQVPGRSKEVGGKSNLPTPEKKNNKFQTACKGGCGREKRRLTLPGKANGNQLPGHLL